MQEIKKIMKNFTSNLFSVGSLSSYAYLLFYFHHLSVFQSHFDLTSLLLSKKVWHLPNVSFLFRVSTYSEYGRCFPKEIKYPFSVYFISLAWVSVFNPVRICLTYFSWFMSLAFSFFAQPSRLPGFPIHMRI